MDEKMKREFVFVFQYVETSNDVIEKDFSVLGDLNGGRFTISRCENTITILCNSLGGLGDILVIATRVFDENNRLKFQRSLGEKLIEFIS